MRQALAEFQGNVDAGSGGRGGQAFGIAEQQVGRAYLDKQRRKPGPLSAGAAGVWNLIRLERQLRPGVSSHSTTH